MGLECWRGRATRANCKAWLYELLCWGDRGRTSNNSIALKMEAEPEQALKVCIVRLGSCSSPMLVLLMPHYFLLAANVRDCWKGKAKKRRTKPGQTKKGRTSVPETLLECSWRQDTASYRPIALHGRTNRKQTNPPALSVRQLKERFRTPIYVCAWSM